MWIDILATFNRQRAQEQKNTILLPWRSALTLLRSQSRGGALDRVRALSNRVGLHAARVPEGLLLLVPKYAETQGVASTGLPCKSHATSTTTPTPTPTKEKREKTRSPLLNLLAKYPGGEDEKAAWLDVNLALIEAEAERGGGSVKTLTIRYYRQYAKAPEAEREFFNHAAKERTRARVAELAAREAEQPTLDESVTPDLGRMFGS